MKRNETKRNGKKETRLRTEQDADAVVIVDDFVQQLVRHGLDGVAGLLFQQPGQHLLFAAQVAAVDVGDLVLKVDESRQLLESVLGGLVQIGDLEEGNAAGVALVVDVLQFLQNFEVLFVRLVV